MPETPRARTSNCTVGLLANASQAVYRVKKDNLIDPTYSEDYNQSLIDLGNDGYAITRAIVPKGSKGTGDTDLGAICIEPTDPHAPIVISYRGTKTSSDIGSDINLGLTGTVSKEFRNSAFDFYTKVREENPNREIVLTGHSLGGHLAQYVAAKAYNTEPDLVDSQLVHVRTFNTAPVNTKHNVVFDNNPQLSSQVVNYRLSSDAVSDLPLQQYQGNTFVFPSERGMFSAHPMGAMKKDIPEKIMQQPVGNSNSNVDKGQAQLLESMNGSLSSYQCRVKGQFFSSRRAGAQNLKVLEQVFSEAEDHIKSGNYVEAARILEASKEKLDGDTSKNLVSALARSTMDIEMNKQIENEAKMREAAESTSIAEEGVAEEAVTDESVKEEAVSEEAVKEEAVTEEAVTEEAVTEEAVTEEAPITETAATEQSAETTFDASMFAPISDSLGQPEGPITEEVGELEVQPEAAPATEVAAAESTGSLKN